jgi:hypothetical protein
MASPHGRVKGLKASTEPANFSHESAQPAMVNHCLRL